MEEIYKSLFSGSGLISEQLMRQLFELSVPDGPVMIYVSQSWNYQTNDLSRARFLQDQPEQLPAICRQIDDGDDPCVCVLDDGCLVGTQLATEKSHCGYFLLFMPGYNSQTVQANMDIFELVLNLAQLVCQLIEKNNQFHQWHLTDLSKRSKVLV